VWHAEQASDTAQEAYPGLANTAGGYGTSEFGAMHAQEIICRYSAKRAVFQYQALLHQPNRRREIAVRGNALRLEDRSNEGNEG
jgi:hypothetical protein